MNLKEKSNSQLRNMLMKDSGYSANEGRAVITEMKSRGLETPPASMVTGGRKVKDVDIAVPKSKPKKKVQMMRGGMANGKVHMYAAGGSVTENPGLKALKSSGPKGMEAYNKITGK